MKTYLNGPDAISDLHKKGFANDFHLSGNDLFWVQENLLLEPENSQYLITIKYPDQKRGWMNSLCLASSLPGIISKGS
jgi:hypothetical protein